MFRSNKPLLTKMQHPLYRVIYAGLYRVDRAVAPRIRIEDTLIISGFWRSGTTWIQNSLAELIGAKMVFEPFHPHNPEMGSVFSEAGIRFSTLHTNMFMPFALPGAAVDHPVFLLAEQALRGTLRHRWTRIYRNHLADAFRPRVIVKFTRGALALRAIQERFENPVLHVRRDPRAVIASAVYKTDQMGGNFTGKFPMKYFLLKIADGREDYFCSYNKEIKLLQKKDLPIRLAGYWALTERFLEDSYAAVPLPRTRFIQYETLARDPERFAVEILEDLGYACLDDSSLEVLHQNSLTTPIRPQSRADQITGWKKILPSNEAAEIAAIAREFGFADALVD